jgi:hypothetical protein
VGNVDVVANGEDDVDGSEQRVRKSLVGAEPLFGGSLKCK